MTEFTAIPIIVVICYLAVTAIKETKINSKWYPLISCGIGTAVSAIFYFCLPDILAVTTLTAALISGAASGLAATGTNQVFKQLLGAAQKGDLTVK